MWNPARDRETNERTLGKTLLPFTINRRFETIGVLFYVTFVLVMATNFILWRYLKAKRLWNKEHNLKQGFIAVAFGVSFLYRAIFDTLAGYTRSSMIFKETTLDGGA